MRAVWVWLLAAVWVGVAGGAGATVTLNLGTAGNAGGWAGSVCGAAAASVAQLGDGIGLAGPGVAQCRVAARWLASEEFLLPAGATGMVLRIAAFTAGGAATLRLNGRTVLIANGEAASIAAGFVPGGMNRLDIAFAGAAADAMLDAALDYVPGGGVVAASNAAADATVSEPGVSRLLAAPLLALAILWRGKRRRPLRGAYSAASRRAAPSIASV